VYRLNEQLDGPLGFYSQAQVLRASLHEGQPFGMILYGNYSSTLVKLKYNVLDEGTQL
jgi:hypothetical protein